MPVIRSDSHAASARPFSLADIQQQAQAVLDRAAEQARQLLAAARAEAQALRERAEAEGRAEGRRRGYEEGRAEGLRAGQELAVAEYREKLAAALAALNAAMESIDRSRRDLETAILPEVVSLSVAIAERVVKRMGALDPEVALANVREALRLVCHAADVRIAVNPRDRSALESAVPSLLLARPDLQHVAVVEDATLAPGGCRVYTARGMVDGDLDVQLGRIAAELLPGPPPASRPVAGDGEERAGGAGGA